MTKHPDSQGTLSATRTMFSDPPMPVVIGELLQDVLQNLGATMLRRVHAAGFDDVRSAHDCVFDFLEPGGVRLRDLADRAGKTPQAIGEHVDELERLGYIERVPDTGDRRAKLIRPTERGTAMMQAALDALREIEREWNEALGPRRLAQLRQTLESIREPAPADSHDSPRPP